MDIHWLLTGEGEPYIKKAEGYKRADTTSIWPRDLRQPQATYGMGAVPAEGDPAPEDGASPDLAQLIHMLDGILKSPNQSLKRAIIANLQAFHDVVVRDDLHREEIDLHQKEISALRVECDNLKTRLAGMERQMEELKKRITDCDLPPIERGGVVGAPRDTAPAMPGKSA